jgi:hypothetical protein
MRTQISFAAPVPDMKQVLLGLGTSRQPAEVSSRAPGPARVGMVLLLFVAVAGFVASATVTWLLLADPGRVVDALAEAGTRALVSMVLDTLRELWQRLRPLL